LHLPGPSESMGSGCPTEKEKCPVGQ
jgi:hypothetical protein